MQITTLIENTKPEGSTLEARHGLGFYIETEGLRLLFDNGPDESFVHNASELGIDLSKVDAFVLSHAHYDHGGGLRAFFALNDHAPVYLLEAARQKYYSLSKGPDFRYIGLDADLFGEYRERFVFFTDETDVSEHIHLFAVRDYNTFRPLFNSLLYKELNGEMVHDDFRHELVMAITEHEVNTVFTGCAHSGILNMVRTVQETMPDVPIHTVIGGFHLLNTATRTLGETPETVYALAKELDNLGVTKIYTGHCTGEEGFFHLHSVLGDKIEALYTGKKIVTERK
jgi:7,8-dihydropterin-6-yl-methyl-4-(beta-D-ribofuranosyl)aminobenzene 5'-phosphate synthase